MCHACSVFVTVCLYIVMHTVGESQVVHHFTSTSCYKNVKRLESVSWGEKTKVCFGGIRPRSKNPLESVGKRHCTSCSAWNWILFRFRIMDPLDYSTVLLSLHGNTKADVYVWPLPVDLWATWSSSCI